MIEWSKFKTKKELIEIEKISQTTYQRRISEMRSIPEFQRGYAVYGRHAMINYEVYLDYMAWKTKQRFSYVDY
ncbi:hypothetical protein SAMN02745116_01756 [Pilibacter termitis]|uniref:Uncharacterized protein n=1 Tax=Pilibacter termitis TaxID=263852 RepID=A0A1T4PCF1_9ENTE|nr:hypothetical protein [Pilibacter termitis]SJZ89255.1 hypothetical protein SAMN02745116_01756 [Pilibacter termitis]